jgi:hypothetical protein
MRLSAVVLVTVLIVACGGPQAPAPGASEPPAPPSTGPLHDVHSAALSAWTTQAKIALSVVGQNDVAVTVVDPDDFEAGPAPVLCTVGGTECTGYAGSYPGIHCALVGYDHVCVVSQPATTLFYAETVSVQNGQVSFPVPCDGRSYQAEVFAAAGSVILDAKRTAAPLSFDASCQGAAASWTDEPRPTLLLPTVYAGPLPAPYDRYTVAVRGLGAPWSPGFTVTCNAAAPLAYAAGSATFLAPSAGTSQVACTAAVPLDRSLLTTAEAASPWTIQLQATGSVIGATVVTGP